MKVPKYCMVAAILAALGAAGSLRSSTFTFTPTPSPTLGCGSPVYQDDFESDTLGAAPLGWTPNFQLSTTGTLSITAGVSGKGMQLLADSGSTWMSAWATDPSAQGLADMALEVKSFGAPILFARIHDSGLGLWTTSAGCQDCYVFHPNGTTGALNLFKMVAGAYVQLSNGGNTYSFGTFPAASTITAKLEIIGDHLRGYVNGILAVDLFDSTHASGSVGVMALGYQLYDDVSVWNCGPAATPSLTPSATPTETPLQSATFSPTVNLTATPTNTPSPVPSATFIPTLVTPGSTATAVATATPKGDRPPVVCPYKRPGDGRPQKIILYSKKGGHCGVKIFRPDGRPCRRLWEGQLGPGEPKTLLWAEDDDNGQRIASGVYLVAFQDGGEIHRTKVIIIR